MNKNGYLEIRAIFEKEGIGMSLLSLSSLPSCDHGPARTILSVNDPRTGIKVSLQDTPEIGRRSFENSVRTSVANGWKLIWRGNPILNGAPDFTHIHEE